MQLLQTSFGNGLLLFYDPKDTVVGGQIAKSHEYEPFEEELLLSSLSQGDSVIDVGANIGAYTLPMAQQVGEKGEVFAFEPEPKNAVILMKNVLDNGFENTIVFPFALSDKETVTRLYLSWDNVGDHRIYDGNYKRPRDSIEVMTERLDDVLAEEADHIAVMKIDTQGYEPFVIEGAKALIQAHKPKIFLEYWPYAYRKAGADKKRMLTFLSDLAYEAYVIDEDKKELVPFEESMFDENKDEGGNLLFT